MCFYQCKGKTSGWPLWGWGKRNLLFFYFKCSGVKSKKERHRKEKKARASHKVHRGRSWNGRRLKPRLTHRHMKVSFKLTRGYSYTTRSPCVLMGEGQCAKYGVISIISVMGWSHECLFEKERGGERESYLLHQEVRTNTKLDLVGSWSFSSYAVFGHLKDQVIVKGDRRSSLKLEHQRIDFSHTRSKKKKKKKDRDREKEKDWF